MDGEEREGIPRYTAPKPSNFLSVRKVEELAEGEKMDLLMFGQQAISKTVFKLMEMIIINARDNAMACNPAKIVEQKALMDGAHAKAEFYHEIREAIRGAAEEHLAKMKQGEVEEAMADEEFVENVILSQALGTPPPTPKNLRGN
jgi:hypothetical protein